MDTKPNMEFKPLNVNVKKSVANGQVYDIIDYEEYTNNNSAYKNRNDVAILDSYKGQDILLPLRGSYNGNPISPGIYDSGPIDFVVFPDETVRSKYIPTKIAEFNNMMSIQDIISSGDVVKRLDEPFITTPDNITRISIEPDDQPEMKILKMALNQKNIDLDKYAARFGDNFPNDKRQLKNNGATLYIIKRFCSNCDMECLLTLRDKNPNVPNPMGKDVTISLTDEFVDDEDN